MEFRETAILLRLSLGALATFFAILLWSRNRDSAWLLIILGTMITYTEIVFSTLEKFGIMKRDFFTILGLPGYDVVELILTNLPLLLYMVAFIIMIMKQKIR